MTAPTLSDFLPSITIDENVVNDTPQLLDGEVTFTDPEGDFDGGTLTVTGLLAEDRVSVLDSGAGAGQIGLSDGNVTYGGTIIGTLTGGAGATLTVLFNASATSVAVERLIERLTYANVSDAPTATRNLVVNVTDAAGEDMNTAWEFQRVSGWDNPLLVPTDGWGNGFGRAAPAFGDLDGDGDLDLVIGRFGGFKVFRNDTGESTPAFLEWNDHQLTSFSFGETEMDPTFVDWDGDGDMDLVSGDTFGLIRYFRNGTEGASGDFIELTGADNPFDNVSTPFFSSPAFLDLDGDGDQDLVTGEWAGHIRTYMNDDGVLTRLPDTDRGPERYNPFVTMSFPDKIYPDEGYGYWTPSFFDLDADGDLDLIFGTDAGFLRASYNRSGSYHGFVKISKIPFIYEVDGGAANPTFADINGDGFLDFVIGDGYGDLTTFINTSRVSGVVTVTVTAQTDGLTATGAPARVASAEDVATNLDLSTITITDAYATRDITVTLIASSGTLISASAQGVTVSGSGTGALILAGTAASIDAFLNTVSGIQYLGVADVYGTDVATVTITATDGSGSVTLGAVRIDITEVDDAGTAVNDGFVVGESGLVSGDVFADNGSGADRDVDSTLLVVEVNGVSAAVGTQITLASGALLTLYTHGAFDYDTNGVFADLPDAGSGASNSQHVETFTYTLSDGQTATVRITVNGEDTAADSLLGTAGDDTLNGGMGADIMTGGDGDDIYYVDNPGDEVAEVEDQGADVVSSSVSYTLQTGSHIENLVLTGTADLDAVGNNVSNTLTGNSGKNVLEGAGGDDILDGKAGADKLIGGLGDDTYIVDNVGDTIVELTGEGTDTVKSSISFAFTGQSLENLTLTGSANINATANSKANILIGNSGNNILDGKSGADKMTGGLGNDTYIVDNVGDVIVEVTGQGTDTVKSSISFAFTGQSLENLTLTGSANINATANTKDNILIGNAGANVLDGKTGADHMTGGLGDDTYIVDNTGDVIVEVTGEGTDTVKSSISFAFTGQSLENLTLTGTANINATANSKVNILIGNSGNNILDGRTGADHMTGGLGDDTYIVDNVGDVIVEVTGEGTDTVKSSISFAFSGQSLENLILTGSANINATANTKANTLVGNSGNNILDGKSGADHMTGGLGDDTYVVDNVGDVIVEVTGEGTDTVKSSISFAFTGQSLENLTLTGTANINATANTKDNILIGNSGNNILDGKTGVDSMSGGKGNDTYIVDNAGDVVVETAAADGVDGVRSSVSYTLTAFVENLTLTGSSNRSAYGNELANTLVGNSGNNTLDGKAGADHMSGGLGDDTYVVDNGGDVIVEVTGQGTDTVKSSISFAFTGQSLENLTLTGTANINATANSKANILIGNTGKNVIDGKGGADVLTGGGGVDTFTFGSTADSTVAASDRITDLSAGDFIDLSQIDANTTVGGVQHFVLVSAFSNTAGQVTLTYDSGTNITSLLADTNGDGTADMLIRINGDHDDHANFIFGG